MNDGAWGVLVICVGAAVACFFLCDLHTDLAEWWSNRNAKY